MNDIGFILECTLENAFVLIPLALITGGISFFAGKMIVRRTKKLILLPLIAAELALFLTTLPYLIRWIHIGSFTWGFWYEGGWDFYLPFSAMAGIFAGYLLGIALKEKA